MGYHVQTHVLDCLHYLHIANIDSVTIVLLQRDYIYDAIIHFNPDFFRIRYHLWIGD